jgi:hypothetical protein
MAPDAKTGLFVQLGDMAHFDSLDPVTPASKHVLDADARAYTMVRAGVKLMRESIDTLLRKHDNVHVIIADANHDPFGAIYLRELLTVAYENEPRVKVDDNPNTYYCFVWGENSLFFHHGHKRKIKDVSRVFAGMYREQYGNSKKSYAHIGHYHHTASAEDALMRSEIHPTLAAKDAYAARGGYISQRAANTIIYDKNHGEVGRITVTPEMALE